MSLPLLTAALLAAGTPAPNADALPTGADYIIVVDAIAPNDPQTVLAPDSPAGPIADQPNEPSGDQDIVVQARTQIAGDPLEQLNVTTYAISTDVDEALVAPIAHAYEHSLPRSLRNILSNFFSNLREPIVAINYLLQLKLGKAVETLGRFVVNTTAGFGGINDVARERPFNLPHRTNGFANTLGYYGVGPGPFLVLPLVGATTLRDVLAGGVDQMILPVGIGRPFSSPYYGVSAYTINSLDFRIEFDEQIQGHRNSSDPYGAMRTAYLARRACEIDALHGRAAHACNAPPAPHDTAAVPPSTPAAEPASDGEDGTP